ncbi:FxsA family protein [Kribbella solani]|uniref:FxsA family protein n=1 Tax=Kribbella solani TaxID=236067 RepID=UPI0029A29BB7|nr:FxsA family protein [Kribbella solani]MDX2967819.1 FxsA family protein [Kribbella solani]MDX3005332.1 FxsA family protein [Kribbella solani]
MPWLLGLALLSVPVVEILVIIQVGHLIGGWPTVGLLVLESLVGAWLVKREGRRAWNALQGSLQSGKLPGRELTNSALVLIGGTLLILPGFVTDVLGLFFLLPFTRPLARRVADRYISRRTANLAPAGFTPPFMPGATQPRPPAGDVIQGEVIDPK